MTRTMTKATNLKQCNQNIVRAMELSDQLMRLAEDGDGFREDESCGVLFGVVRDCAYRIRSLADKEMSKHQQSGRWK